MPQFSDLTLKGFPLNLTQIQWKNPKGAKYDATNSQISRFSMSPKAMSPW